MCYRNGYGKIKRLIIHSMEKETDTETNTYEDAELINAEDAAGAETQQEHTITNYKAISVYHYAVAVISSIVTLYLLIISFYCALSSSQTSASSFVSVLMMYATLFVPPANLSSRIGAFLLFLSNLQFRIVVERFPALSSRRFRSIAMILFTVFFQTILLFTFRLLVSL